MSPPTLLKSTSTGQLSSFFKNTHRTLLHKILQGLLITLEIKPRLLCTTFEMRFDLGSNRRRPAHDAGTTLTLFAAVCCVLPRPRGLCAGRRLSLEGPSCSYSRDRLLLIQGSGRTPPRQKGFSRQPCSGGRPPHRDSVLPYGFIFLPSKRIRFLFSFVCVCHRLCPPGECKLLMGALLFSFIGTQSRDCHTASAK